MAAVAPSKRGTVTVASTVRWHGEAAVVPLRYVVLGKLLWGLVVGDMPVVAFLELHAGQVRSDPSGVEKMWAVLGAFPGLEDRSPSK